jgi:anti-anti-sigma regulatory factor
MEISVSTVNAKRPITVFRITGEISSYNYQALEEKARQSHAEGMRDLLIDMKNVTFVSSGGIRALTVILKILHTAPPKDATDAKPDEARDSSSQYPHLKLVNVAHRIKDIFKIAGVDVLLEIHDDFQKAVDAF